MIKGFIITAISEKGIKYIKKKIILPIHVKFFFNRIVLNKDPLTVAIDFKVNPLEREFIKWKGKIIKLTPDIKKELEYTIEKHMCLILDEVSKINWIKGEDYTLEVLKDE